MTKLKAILWLEVLGTVPLSDLAELYHLQQQKVNLNTVQSPGQLTKLVNQAI